ncbi:YqzM family protein [Pueribacillus theae]|uniref:YqzM family protein n=1 Tax=Pueribacillus theae TaxID=2171751 RepID=A0A2U1K4P5_9BACI|nr:YqzM family protein [Pueribacillus theae]PWA12497.1 YqzM family protein [Pueribacillus theae]
MNEFEKDVQSKTNDVIDSGFGFIFSFVFFSLIFFIGVIMKAVG